MSITIICGHYGCGKTNLALNLALDAAENGPVTLVDLDIVNPYFRSSDYLPVLKDSGIRLIAPVFAGTTLDTPTLPPEVQSIFAPGAGTVYIDAGGDDAGATVLGGLSANIKKSGYEMLYVVNRNRVLSQTPEDCAAILREIEAASRLKATGIVNNSHLGVETSWENVRASLPFAHAAAEAAGLPLLYSTVPDFALEGEGAPEGFRVVKRLVTFAWE